MNLCDACTSFARAISQKTRIDDAYFNHTIEVLRQRNRCSFCTWFLLSSIYSRITDQTYTTLNNILSDREESFDADKHRITYTFDAKDSGCYFFILAPSGAYGLRVAFSAEAGTAAYARGWPLTSTLLPPENRSRDGYFAYIRTWLATCSCEHIACRSTIAEEIIDGTVSSILPTRVLEIEAGPLKPFIKLLPSRERRGVYFALSHRWGTPEKHPLETTKDNFQSHIQGISFESLPQTFQDAIELTNSLGVQYLWIDSLCIIQDDEQDWKNEAEEMGTIFENATLTIGAAGAEDSSQGLFSPIRRRQARASIPYGSGDERLRQRCQERLFVGEWYDCSPYWGTLRQRGWIFQEAYLSRRQVFFTKGGIAWMCREKCLDQFGNGLWSMERMPDWVSILQNYNDCELTRASDRLIALEGLVRRRKKTWQDDYSYGVWHARVTEHILWFSTQTGSSSDDLPYLPSWSWAATSGKKRFWGVYSAEFDRVRTSCQNMITITDAGLMRLRETPMISCSTIKGLEPHYKEMSLRLAKAYFSGRVKDRLVDILTLFDGVLSLVGSAALDREGELCSPSCCISLEIWHNLKDFFHPDDPPASDDIEQVSTGRHEPKPDHEPDEGEEMKTLRGSEDVFENNERKIKSSRESEAGGDPNWSGNDSQGSGLAVGDEYQEKKTDLSDLEEENMSCHVVLMLEPVPDRANHYRRVGMGIIPGFYWERANITYQDVFLF